MSRWKLGEAEVEALIASGDLQKLTGEAANGERLLAKAAVTLETARSAAERDPDSAFVLACPGAPFASMLSPLWSGPPWF